MIGIILMSFIIAFVNLDQFLYRITNHLKSIRNTKSMALINRVTYLILTIVALIYIIYPSISKGQDYTLLYSLPEKILGFRYPYGIAIDNSSVSHI